MEARRSLDLLRRWGRAPLGAVAPRPALPGGSTRSSSSVIRTDMPAGRGAAAGDFGRGRLRGSSVVRVEFGQQLGDATHAREHGDVQVLVAQPPVGERGLDLLPRDAAGVVVQHVEQLLPRPHAGTGRGRCIAHGDEGTCPDRALSSIPTAVSSALPDHAWLCSAGAVVTGSATQPSRGARGSSRGSPGPAHCTVHGSHRRVTRQSGRDDHVEHHRPRCGPSWKMAGDSPFRVCAATTGSSDPFTVHRVVRSPSSALPRSRARPPPARDAPPPLPGWVVAGRARSWTWPRVRHG